MDDRLREVESILAGKEGTRRRQARMSFEEKIEIVERLRSLRAGFGARRGDPKSQDSSNRG